MTEKSLYFSELSELQKNETLFFTLSEFSPAGIYLTNKDGDCLYVNKHWQMVAGLSADKALGRGWKAALHHDDIDEIYSQWYKVVETEGKWKFEYRFVNQETNKVTWLLGLAKPLYDNEGILKGYMGLNIDITEEKLKAEKLKESLSYELQDTRKQLEKLQGILPICVSCKKIHNAEDDWLGIDEYIMKNSNAQISHGICPDCLLELYPSFYKKNEIG